MDKNNIVVIGLMSGTSLDGLDIAACEFTKAGTNWKYNILAAETIPYLPERRETLGKLMQGSALDLAREDFNFGYFQGEEVAKFLSTYQVHGDLVAAHGHTIFHQPDKNFTYQIGNGACIAARCNLPVISDFRSMDVALGGQGAPLVPIGDKLLFAEYRFCLNLGGIANISYDNAKSNRLAFDICPVNLVMNKLAERKGAEYDRDGLWAREGKINTDLYDLLESLEFYKLAGPKSLGKEWIDEVVMPLIDSFEISIEDKLHTFCLHIASRLQTAIGEASETNKLLLTGGGALNKFLVEAIRQKTKLEVVVPSMETILFKEALIFAFLGYLRYQELTNALASVTGARKDSSGGSLFLKP